MAFDVITNPSFIARAGFTNAQFKKLDDLYCRAASEKILTYRTVECDFEEGVAAYTYYQSADQPPFLRFVIMRVGPRDMMYEVFHQKAGKLAKSGSFDRAFERLRGEIEILLGK